MGVVENQEGQDVCMQCMYVLSVGVQMYQE